MTYKLVTYILLHNPSAVISMCHSMGMENTIEELLERTEYVPQL